MIRKIGRINLEKYFRKLYCEKRKANRLNELLKAAYFERKLIGLVNSRR